MKYYSVYDYVGISVSDSYPWVDTLFITHGVSKEGKKEYLACQQKICIRFEKELPMDDVRFIGDGAYIGDDVYVDEQYGVRIERKAGRPLTLRVSQECNEWLVIALQLCLLECDRTLIHAAALEKDGQVLLLPSWGGVGKTATVCRFVREHGWRLLGDDLVILGGGEVKPFLKPFVIYPYHKDLFPELFANGENHTVKNLAVSSMMSRMIPGVKRALRPFPRALAYLRKHNPQSMRVAPTKIFTPDQISAGGVPMRMVWLERSMGTEIRQSQIPGQALASKAVSVSSVELFAAKLESVFHMCGCGMLSYDETLGKMRQIILDEADKVPCALLEIPNHIHITEVGSVIYENLLEG